MNKVLLCIITLILVAGCANKPPETIVEKKWGVTDEGNWEEEEIHSTTVYSSGDDDMPELKLPTDKSIKQDKIK